MAQAIYDLTPHQRNMQTILRIALDLADEAGRETDAMRRAELIAATMAAWRAAQRMRRYPDYSRTRA
jgi:hypothetical protein